MVMVRVIVRVGRTDIPDKQREADRQSEKPIKTRNLEKQNTF